MSYHFTATILFFDCLTLSTLGDLKCIIHSTLINDSET